MSKSALNRVKSGGRTFKTRAFIQCLRALTHSFMQGFTNVILALTYQLHGQETTGTPVSLKALGHGISSN